MPLPGNNAENAQVGPGSVRRSALEAAGQAEVQLTPLDVLALVSEPLQEVEKEFRRNLATDFGLAGGQ